MKLHIMYKMHACHARQPTMSHSLHRIFISIYYLFPICKFSSSSHCMRYFTTHVHDDLMRRSISWQFWEEEKNRIKSKMKFKITTKIYKKIEAKMHSFKWNLFPRFSNKQRNVNSIRGIQFFSYILWYKSKECNHFKDMTWWRRDKKEIRWFYGK